MPLTRATRTSRLNKPNLTRAAGWTAVAFGAVHIVVSPLDNRDVWSDIFDQGPWQTISLDVTPENLAYSEAFWVAPGSFGVPVLLLGAFVLSTARRGERVPAPFGWAMTAWGVVLAALLPASPAWVLLLVGVLLVLAAHGPDARDVEDH
ncbi:DUF6463 family protein [Streptomyces sp. DH10]|uniref:DUF6463 family protein n=1 Tax=Streptomyces sp. DH10 TaxID=3040121 RepID=UPI002442C56D|nr:DUF6463 family protein [Streptomyces sp. DH10]MDG9714868.1 DUF6463 family protein [Streptomyces sp. DH10]